MNRKTKIMIRIACVPCLLVMLAVLVNGCVGSSPSTAEQVTAIQKEIQDIEAICVPQEGVSRKEVEKIFGVGKPLPPTPSKTPHKGKIPADSPRRSYQLCENGILLVRYDDDWRVQHASYINPYSVKGRPIGTQPSAEELLVELKPRLEQMKMILKVYKRKSG